MPKITLEPLYASLRLSKKNCQCAVLELQSLVVGNNSALVAKDLISDDPNNSIETGTDGKLYSNPSSNNDIFKKIDW